MKFFFLLLFMSSTLSAQDRFVQRPDVSKSPCKNSPPTEEEMNAYLEAKKTGHIKSKLIAGAKLRDDETLLRIFGEIHNQDPKYKKDTWRFAKGTRVSLTPRCESVACAMTQLYGKKHGLQLLYMREKFGFNSSATAVGYPGADQWSDSDFGIVLAMLNDFPQRMFPILEGTRFIHVNAQGRGGHNMIAEALVHVYLGWHKLPASEKTTSLAHELGHLFSINKWNTTSWLILSHWGRSFNEKKELVWTMGDRSAAPLGYARTNPNEDFAETFFLYRYNGKGLRRLHPEKYEYMRVNVFHGAEFDSEESCR